MPDLQYNSIPMYNLRAAKVFRVCRHYFETCGIRVAHGYMEKKIL